MEVIGKKALLYCVGSKGDKKVFSPSGQGYGWEDRAERKDKGGASFEKVAGEYN
ncbi:MAG: hypothetical protein Q7J31_11320 [Syntrophales bacterium]|nr:hypothetical protein [Syntrophales bacterium]